MARITLYVPDDLKARMDAAGDRINWSEVARPALLGALTTHEHRQENTMTSAIERLRASKQEADTEDQTEGFEHGRSWASDEASYRDLQRLARDWDEAFHNDLDPLDTLTRAVDPNSELTRFDLLNHLFGDGTFEASDEYYWAFIKGAVRFFTEVRPQLR
jgi:hypothetical protein